MNRRDEMKFVIGRRIVRPSSFLLLLSLSVAYPHWPSSGAVDPQSQDQQRGAQPVILTVTVRDDHGELVTGLRQDDFVVLADKDPQKVTYFDYEDKPISVGLLVDMSASMASRREPSNNDRKLRAYQEALTHFFEHHNLSNQYFLMGISDQPQLMSDWTLDTKAILNQFRLIQFQGHTAFYDACYQAVEKIMRVSMSDTRLF